MLNDFLSVTLVHHVAVDIARPAELVWQAILEEYVEAKKFRELGYAIEPLDHPAAYLGGYRMQFEQDGAVVDSRDCLITERDEAAHRLSIFADYRTAPNGMAVYVTYHAKAGETGTCYTIDCHSTLGIDRPADPSPASVDAAVSTLHEQFRAALSGYLAGMKAKLEAT